MRARIRDHDYPRPVHRHASLVRGLLLLTIAAGCASVPERVGKPRSRDIHRWPQAVPSQGSSMALLELDDVDWIQLDTLRVDHTEYGTMELPPGTYCVTATTGGSRGDCEPSSFVLSPGESKEIRVPVAAN